MTVASQPNLKTLRVDQVGSLLRPATLKQAFAKFSLGEISAEQLRAAQDKAIRDVIAKQEACNLPVVVDGEFRRTSFMESFSVVTGVEEWQAGVKTYHQILARKDTNEATSHKGQDPILLNRKRVTAKLKLLRNGLLDDFRFAQALTDRTVKVTLISADRITQCFDSENSKSIYPSVDAFLADVVAVARQIIAQLAGAGCRYVGIDGPGYTAYVDPDSLAAMRARGEDPTANMARSIKADNETIAGFPGVTFGIHICRGNRQSMWHREGHYDAIAEQLFNGLNHPRLLLEYDTERAGSFEALRFVPKNKVVILGLISSKLPLLEDASVLIKRIEEAAHYMPLENMGLSPQCGFSSTSHGNNITMDDQWRKLELAVKIAAKVWGYV